MKTLKESLETESCDVEIENSNEFKLLNDALSLEIQRYTNTISNTRDKDLSATKERLESFTSLKNKLDSCRENVITNLNIAQLTSFRTAISGFYGRKKNELNEDVKNQYLKLAEYFDYLIGKIDQNP